MITSKSEAETEEAGARLAPDLKAGDVVALCGGLGAGKTQFVKGMARGLGCPAPVTSPTFTLVHEYSGGRLPIYHFDWYRLEKIEALHAIGFDEYIFANGVSVIEWADKFRRAVPRQARWITLHIVSLSERVIELPIPS